MKIKNNFNNHSISKADIERAQDLRWLSPSKNRGAKSHLEIDSLKNCSLQRANTMRENEFQILFHKSKTLQRLPFVLFRGVKLKKLCVDQMLESGTTLDFAFSKNYDKTYLTSYFPIANTYSHPNPFGNSADMKKVVFILPPESIEVEASLNVDIHAFIVQDAHQLANKEIDTHWNEDDTTFIQIKK